MLQPDLAQESLRPRPKCDPSLLLDKEQTALQPPLRLIETTSDQVPSRTGLRESIEFGKQDLGRVWGSRPLLASATVELVASAVLDPDHRRWQGCFCPRDGPRACWVAQPG